MRHCDDCGFLRVYRYEYPESYCGVGVRDDDPKFDEDKDGCGCRYNIRTLRKADIYAGIEVGKTYRLTVRGDRFGLFSWYPNIYEYQEVEDANT